MHFIQGFRKNKMFVQVVGMAVASGKGVLSLKEHLHWLWEGGAFNLYIILLLSYNFALFVCHSMWDLNFPTGDRAGPPGWKHESYLLDRLGCP